MITLPAPLRFKIYLRDQNQCISCKKRAQDGASLEVAHMVPRTAGGTNSIHNLLTLCLECTENYPASANHHYYAPLKKHNHIPPEYALGMMLQAVNNFRSQHGKHDLSFEEARMVVNDPKYVSRINPLFTPLPMPAVISAALVLHQEGKLKLEMGLIRI
ncbi:MAG: HNH endonuclease [Candidatus Micrarchaeota archaeon]